MTCTNNLVPILACESPPLVTPLLASLELLNGQPVTTSQLLLEVATITSKLPSSELPKHELNGLVGFDNRATAIIGNSACPRDHQPLLPRSSLRSPPPRASCRRWNSQAPAQRPRRFRQSCDRHRREFLLSEDNDPLAKAFIEEAMKKQKKQNDAGVVVVGCLAPAATGLAPVEVLQQQHEDVTHQVVALLQRPSSSSFSSAASVTSATSTLLDQLSTFNLDAISPATQATFVESQASVVPTVFGMPLIHSPLSLKGKRLLDELTTAAAFFASTQGRQHHHQVAVVRTPKQGSTASSVPTIVRPASSGIPLAQGIISRHFPAPAWGRHHH
ncbi:hypothetical protein FRB90_009910 [Tulasnella sp. 427]|nr:hypothetical protein FRB90_009910 [Tulasnella sp. 427]